MSLKKKIIGLIEKSGKEHKDVVAILDEIRKNYHNRKNVGDKIVSQRELSKMVAIIREKEYPLSKDKGFIFYQGAWRKVYGQSPNRYVIYLKGNISVKFAKR